MQRVYSAQEYLLALGAVYHRFALPSLMMMKLLSLTEPSPMEWRRHCTVSEGCGALPEHTENGLAGHAHGLHPSCTHSNEVLLV